MISSQGHGAATDVGSKTLDAGGSRDANLLHFRVGDDHPTYVKLLMGHVTALRVQFGRVLLLDFHASPGHVFFSFFFPPAISGTNLLGNIPQEPEARPTAQEATGGRGVRGICGDRHTYP